MTVEDGAETRGDDDDFDEHMQQTATAEDYVIEKCAGVVLKGAMG